MVRFFSTRLGFALLVLLPLALLLSLPRLTQEEPPPPVVVFDPGLLEIDPSLFERLREHRYELLPDDLRGLQLTPVLEAARPRPTSRPRPAPGDLELRACAQQRPEPPLLRGPRGHTRRPVHCPGL